jgi:hypothetical protein
MPDKRPAKRQVKRERAQPRRSSAQTEAPQAEKSKAASGPTGGPALTYEPNPKHKEPWQRGARGTLCPREADGSALLATSQVDPKHPGGSAMRRTAPLHTVGMSTPLITGTGSLSSGGRFLRLSATHGSQRAGLRRAASRSTGERHGIQ